MLDTLKRWVLRILRVPSDPTPPGGATEAWVFRAAPRYFQYRLTLWAVKQFLALLGLVASLVFLSLLSDRIGHPLALLGLRGAEILAWIVFLLQIPFSYAVLRLDFELRWYIVSERSLRIREGVLSLREKTITFANVQNVEVRRNPLQRMLGLADVRVRTAGGGGGASNGSGQVGESMHEAYFRGVDQPEKIRGAILDRVRRQRDSGLGDPEDQGADQSGGSGSPPQLIAAQELRQEAALLRGALERRAANAVSADR